MIWMFLTGAGVLDNVLDSWMVSTCPDGAMLKISLKSVEFKGIKNSLKD